MHKKYHIVRSFNEVPCSVTHDQLTDVTGAVDDT